MIINNFNDSHLCKKESLWRLPVLEYTIKNNFPLLKSAHKGLIFYVVFTIYFHRKSSNFKGIALNRFVRAYLSHNLRKQVFERVLQVQFTHSHMKMSVIIRIYERHCTDPEPACCTNTLEF